MAVTVCATHYKRICIRTSEHWLDWFHITMRISLLQQQVKTLKNEQPEELEAVLRPAGRRRQYSPPRACWWCEADHQLLLPESVTLLD